MKVGDMIEATKEIVIYLGPPEFGQGERLTEIGDFFIVVDIKERNNSFYKDKYRFSVDIYDIKSCQNAYDFYLFDLQEWTKVVD